MWKGSGALDFLSAFFAEVFPVSSASTTCVRCALTQAQVLWLRA
jgi:hypothetical protein